MEYLHVFYLGGGFYRYFTEEGSLQVFIRVMGGGLYKYFSVGLYGYLSRV